MEPIAVALGMFLGFLIKMLELFIGFLVAALTMVLDFARSIVGLVT